MSRSVFNILMFVLEEKLLHNLLLRNFFSKHAILFICVNKSRMNARQLKVIKAFECFTLKCIRTFFNFLETQDKHSLINVYAWLNEVAFITML